MARASKKIDENQLTLDFSAAIDHFTEAKDKIQTALERKEEARYAKAECEFEACIEIAAAIKRQLRDSGLSREQLVDGINAYFGRTDESHQGEEPTSRRPLSVAMMNHYLSKPVEYPIPAYMLIAINAVFQSLASIEPFVEPFGGRIVTGIELQQLQLGQLEQLNSEMNKIRRQLKRR